MKKLSVIVPCYNEEECILKFYKELKKVIKNIKINLELIFVNDGSVDKTLEIIKNLTKDKSVKYISFSRNFGKEAAMWAGLNMSIGDYVTIMDCDLQDPPSMLSKMIDLIEKEKYDMVGTRRISRKGEPPIRSFFARQFYKIINKISKVEMVDGARDFRLMTRQVVDSILMLKEYNRYSKGLFNFVGYNTKWLEYENVQRVAGETKWSFFKLLIYAIEGIVAFSTIPLIVSVLFGFLFCVVAFLLLVLMLIRILFFSDPVSSWFSLVCIIFFLSGIQLLCVGIMGQYLSKMYLEVKQRPVYIVKETNIK